MSTYDHKALTRNFRTKITVCECGCWVFSTTDRYGYPKMKLKGGTVIGHRYAYEKLVGGIPEGHDLDHLCHNTRACVNPEHLEAVPKSENARRANQRRWHEHPVKDCESCDGCVLRPTPDTTYSTE